MSRRIQFASLEHQQREMNALHTHHSSRQLSYYGNGSTVMVVAKRQPAFVEILGEDDREFNYNSYFLPEELANNDRCPRCDEPFQWDGDTEDSRVCPSCRADEAEFFADTEAERGL